jgi:dihydrolipoamide dehydrogenase
VPERYDVAVLGGGFGGYVAAIRAAQLGLNTVLVERDKVGGTCLHRGCIPTKALLQTAYLLDAARHSARFGVNIGDVELDYPTAAKYRDQVVNRLFRGVESLLKKNRVTVVRGHGRFASGGTIHVSGSDADSTLEGQSVILASGSRPRSLPGLDIDGRHVITSDEALQLDRVPRSAVILGAGAIGVEFASMYRSMGSEVTLVEVAERIVPLEDDDVGTQLQRSFERRGIHCLVGAALDATSLERNEGGIAVTVARDGKEERLQGELLLVAVGRAANTEDIGIDGTSVRTENGVVVVDDLQATGEAGVYAVGDMVGGFWLAHKAAHQGVIAAEVIAGQDPAPLDPMLVPRTTYCSPQIGSLGLSEREARAAGHEVRTGTFPFLANSRAVIWDEPEGFCKVVADATTDEILGVHLLGHDVTELIAGPALGGLLEATPYEMSRAVAPHPTLSEVLAEAAMAVRGQAIHV